ncbi:MAG: hypothetical protein ACM3NQ_05635 [Bacteroidales bacterium]
MIERESFWTAVYEPFMQRDLTREDVRGVVRLGLEQADGSYRLLVELFHMPATDYKRFLNFLRAYECQMPNPRFPIITMAEAEAYAPCTRGAVMRAN